MNTATIDPRATFLRDPLEEILADLPRFEGYSSRQKQRSAIRDALLDLALVWARNIMSGPPCNPMLARAMLVQGLCTTFGLDPVQITTAACDVFAKYGQGALKYVTRAEYVLNGGRYWPKPV
jgi:hypothetical protein